MIILLPITRLVLSSGLLYGYYYLFLRNRRFHRYNRFYLLLATVLALLSSFVSIPWHLAPAAQNGSGLVHTLQSISGGSWMEADTGEGITGPGETRWLTPANGLLLLYLAGAATGLTVLLRSLFYIGRIRRKYPSWGIGNIRFYDTSEPGTPFSFFRLVFWNSNIPFNDRQGQQIFRHELYHVEQRHSLDVLWLELLCSVAWFNPFFHLLRKEMKVLHEFLADEYAASQNNRLDYAELLVTQALLLSKNRLSHPFAQTHIKRRIMMLTKSNHARPGRPYLSRAMALPLLLLSVSAFTLRPVTHGPLHRAATPVSVVIDAGHGGTDPGAQVDGL
ncbi:MAG TPA: M56 family metallopeptidase, partial [Chitinophagaceae bacterium]|nr:M56 family metallopeptidase [Chitinophagaceae bacterium]